MASAVGRGSVPIFSFKGIKVRLHWSFLALPAFIIFNTLEDGQPWSAVWNELAMVGVVFLCVVLHEFGHALTARRYGVGTRDIVLLPIGGVASLERMPEDPKQEFWITLAGPMVNLAIAVLALLVMAVLGITTLVTDLLVGGPFWSSMLLSLFALNVGLFLFNLIPAFPMDGGRLLRSLLAMRMRREKATRIATTVGRVLAVGIIAFAIFQGQPFLALIGAFVFMAAGAEARQAAQRDLLKGVPVSQVMRTRFLALGRDLTVRMAMGELIAGAESAAVVVDGAVPVGVVDRAMLAGAGEAGRWDSVLADLPPRVVAVTSPTDDAQELMRRMMAERIPMAPVVEAGVLVGAVDPAKVHEVLNLRRVVEGGGQR